MSAPSARRARLWITTLCVVIVAATVVGVSTWVRHVERTQHALVHHTDRDRMALEIVCHRQDAVIATLALLTAPARQALVTNPSIDPATLRAIMASNLAIRRAVRAIAATPCTVHEEAP